MKKIVCDKCGKEGPYWGPGWIRCEKKASGADVWHWQVDFCSTRCAVAWMVGILVSGSPKGMDLEDLDEMLAEEAKGESST